MAQKNHLFLQFKGNSLKVVMTDENYEKLKHYIETTLSLQITNTKEEPRNRKRNIYNDDDDNVWVKTHKLNSGDKAHSKEEHEAQLAHVDEKINFFTSAIKRTEEDIKKYSAKIKKYEEAGVKISTDTQTIEEFYSSGFNEKRNRLKYAKKRLKEAETSNEFYQNSKRENEVLKKQIIESTQKI